MKKLIKNKKFLIALASALVFVIASIVIGLFALSNKNEGYVARVDGVGIPTAAFDEQITQQQAFYKQANQTTTDSELKQTTLNTLIDNQLLENYATQNAIKISQEQVNDYYNQRVSAYKSEQELLDTLNKLYGTNKEQYLQTIRYDLLRDAVQASVKQPLTEWLTTQRQTADIKIYISI